MKATLLKAVVCVTLVFAGALNANLKAQDKFVTNDVMTGERVTSRIIYRHDGQLHPHMKHDFKYDDQNRVIEKETFKWESSKKDWVPYCKTDFNYTTEQVIVNYAKWNTRDKAYNEAREKNIYELNTFNVPVVYQNYKWNSLNGDWKIIENLRFEQTGVLYAKNR